MVATKSIPDRNYRQRRDDVHAGEREPLEESCGVFLVPAESIQRLCEHDVELLVQRIPHQPLETGMAHEDLRPSWESGDESPLTNDKQATPDRLRESGGRPSG
jgi:hypothetical protein